VNMCMYTVVTDGGDEIAKTWEFGILLNDFTASGRDLSTTIPSRNVSCFPHVVGDIMYDAKKVAKTKDGILRTTATKLHQTFV
jgi:hypothetical protein